ncbi:MAG: DMT family transporter [Treponema sp.]|nr:DMT family transporter [Treponema sp.]
MISSSPTSDEPLQKKSRARFIKGALCIVFSAFNFALMAALARLAGDVPFGEKAFFRNLVAVFVMGFLLFKNRAKINFPKGALKFLLLRSTAGSIGILGNFYALDRIPIADAGILNKMSPFFAVIFSLLLLGEKIAFVPMLSTIGAFLGAVFVIKPGASLMHSLPALAGFLGGMGAGFAYTCVRKLGEMKTSGELVIAFFSLFSCLLCLPFMLFDFCPLSTGQLLALLGAGVAGCLGQFGITYAYFFAPARDISIFDYSQIIFSSFLGFVMFNQIPDALSWIGYAIIASMALVVFIYNKRKFAAIEKND